MRYKGSLVFVLDLFDMGLTSAEGQKQEHLNEEQLIFVSVRRKSGNPLSVKSICYLGHTHSSIKSPKKTNYQ